MDSTTLPLAPYQQGIESFAQALTDEQAMVEDSAPYREYVEEAAREHAREASETFEVMDYSEWLADRELDERVERGLGER